LTDDIISQQTIRMMRSIISNSSQYTDEELSACGMVIASLYPMVSDVPSFLPQREQATFFANMVSCFMMGDLVNNGIFDPHQAKNYLDMISTSMNTASDFSPQDTDENEDDDTIVVMSGKSKSAVN
jgi:hypothetical protein